MNVTSSDTGGDESGTHGVSEIFGEIFHLIIRSFFYTLFWCITKKDTLIFLWFFHDMLFHRFIFWFWFRA